MKKIVLAILLIVAQLYASGIYATFTVEANKSANLAFNSGGVVDRLFVDITSVVKKGDILAQLKNADQKARVDIAAIALKYAKKDYDRQLKVKNMIDKSKLDSYAYKYENAKAQLTYQQSLLDKTYLKAPFNGKIYDKTIEVGDVVTAMNPKTIFKIQSRSKRKLVLEFDQKYWKKVKVGDIFKFTIDGDDKKYTAKIAKIYPNASSDNRKIKAEVYTQQFLVGLFGDGYIIVDKD